MTISEYFGVSLSSQTQNGYQMDTTNLGNVSLCKDISFGIFIASFRAERIKRFQTEDNLITPSSLWRALRESYHSYVT